MKLPKFTKKTKLRIAQAVSVVAYSAAVAVYGILNYEEGKEAECRIRFTERKDE